PRFVALPASSGVCAPGPRKKQRSWAGTATYRFNDDYIGIRSDSIETDRLLGRLFAAHRAPDFPNPPAHFSVVLPGAHRQDTKELNLLLLGDRTLVRSRSPRRVTMALASYLTAFFGP